MGHFSLVSYLRFLKYWELTLVMSDISPEVGFYTIDMCTEVVTLGSPFGQWRERGTSAVWFISVQRRMNPGCKCLFLPTSQWGTLGLLIQHSCLAGVTPAARCLKAEVLTQIVQIDWTVQTHGYKLSHSFNHASLAYHLHHTRYVLGPHLSPRWGVKCLGISDEFNWAQTLTFADHVGQDWKGTQHSPTQCMQKSVSEPCGYYTKSHLSFLASKGGPNMQV